MAACPPGTQNWRARPGQAFCVLSTRSSRRIEDVAGVLAAEGGSWWFQVYMLTGRSLTAALPKTRRAAALVLAGRAAYRGTVRSSYRAQRDQAHLVTEARRSLSDDIAYRQRRYLIMMGIRVACFVVAVVLFVNHAGWLTAIPAAGAIFIPYFAVVFANGGREPTANRGFREYQPNLPERSGPSQAAGPRTSGQPGNTGNAGPPVRKAPSGTETG